MPRPSLEVADIFRGHGPAWRRANAGHVSLGQLKVMSAIERCRTAAVASENSIRRVLGGLYRRCLLLAGTWMDVSPQPTAALLNPERSLA